MIKLKFSINEEVHGKGFFKFNQALLKESSYVGKVKQTIRKTILQYALSVYSSDFMANHGGEVDFAISDSLLWEVLILNIRTETVTYSIHRKREMKKE